MIHARTIPVMLATLWLGLPALGEVPGAQRVELNTGEVFIAPVVEEDDARVVLDHPLAGRVTIPRDQIKQVADPAQLQATPPPQAPASNPTTPVPSGPATAAPAVTTPPAPKTGLARFLDEWNIQLSVGANTRDADVDTANYNAGLTATHEDKDDRWKIDAKFFYGEVNNVTTQQDVHAFIQKDWLFDGSPWFIFSQGQYDHDQFKSWEHRGSLHGGLGYDLKPVIGVDAKLRGGFGATREFGGVDPDTRIEGLAGGELAWQLHPKHTVAGNLQWYPQVDDADAYRIRATGDYTYKLTQELSLRVGVWDEYDSTEPEGFQKNDLRVYGSLVFDF